MTSLELARPALLWALPVLLVVYALIRRRVRARDTLPHAPLQLAPSARRGWAARLELPVELLLVATLVVGLAGPYRLTELELSDSEGIDVMLVLDISLSMLAEDFPPTRLDALREIAGDFLRRAGSNRLGIVTFASDAFSQSPLTTNHAVLRSMLDDVSVYAIDQSKSGGTAIGTALLVAADALDRAATEGRDQALILITDGESNQGVEPVFAARYLAELGIRTYLIGVGGTEPVQVFFEGEPVGTGDDPYLAVLDDAELTAIGEAANGVYVRASERDALEEVFAHLTRLESAPLETRTVQLRRSASAPLAAIALPLFVAYLLLGGVWLRRPLR